MEQSQYHKTVRIQQTRQNQQMLQFQQIQQILQHLIIVMQPWINRLRIIGASE